MLRDGLARAGADVGARRPADAARRAAGGAALSRLPGRARTRCARCARAGHRLVVVSNWDVSLHETLRSTGLAALLDGAISSAEAGVREARPAHLRGARSRSPAASADGALHAGDTLEYDVAGARAAGWRAVLVARGGRPPRVAAGRRR